MTEALITVNEQLSELGLNYEFGKIKESPPTYPYWVGDCSDSQSDTEDGKEEITVILSGFARGDFIPLENQKQIIKDYYKHGVYVTTASGATMVIFYGGSFTVPQEETDLKKCQVNLLVKLWKE